MTKRRKSSRVKTWAIRAGRKLLVLRSTRKPRVLKVVNRQTGSRKSISRDRLRKALPPGKRISRHGIIYYEYRRNRTDRPGKRI